MMRARISSLIALLWCYWAAGPPPPKPPKPPPVAPAPAPPSAPCARVVGEARRCMAIVGHGKAHVATTGLDGGTACVGPALDVELGDINASLGWIGDRLYACQRDRGVLEIAIADGKTRLAPGTCEAVTTMGNELLVQPRRTFAMDETRPFLERYANLGDLLASRSAGRRLATGITSILAARDGVGYFARGSTYEIYALPFQPYAHLQTVPLERFDDTIHGLDVTHDGTLVIAARAPGSGQADELRQFDAATGAARRTVSVAAQPGLSIAASSATDLSLRHTISRCSRPRHPPRRPRGEGDAITSVRIQATDYDAGSHGSSAGWKITGWVFGVTGATLVAIGAGVGNDPRTGTHDGDNLMLTGAITVTAGALCYLLGHSLQAPASWQLEVSGKVIKHTGPAVQAPPPPPPASSP